MKRPARALLSGLAALAVTLAAGAACAADSLRIATQPAPFFAPIFVAQKKGWLDEELKPHGAPRVVVSLFAAGPPINESFAAGQQDLGFLGDTPAIIGKAAGLDTRLIGKTSLGPQTLAVVTSATSSLAKPADLKGKKVAVTKGSYAHHLLALVLQQGGLSFNDIELINLANGDAPAALASGAVDAAAIWEPVLTKFLSQKAIKVLADGTGIKAGVLAVVATNDILKSQPEQVKAVLRAYARGADYIKTQPQDAAALVSPDVNLAPELLTQVFAKYDYNPVLRDADVAEIKKSAEFMKAIGLIKQAVDVDAFIDRGVNAAAGLK